MDMIAKAAIMNLMSDEQRQELATLEFQIQKQILETELEIVRKINCKFAWYCRIASNNNRCVSSLFVDCDDATMSSELNNNFG